MCVAIADPEIDVGIRSSRAARMRSAQKQQLRRSHATRAFSNRAERAGLLRQIGEMAMRNAQINSNVTWFEQHLADGYVDGYSWGEWATKADFIKQVKSRNSRRTR